MPGGEVMKRKEGEGWEERGREIEPKIVWEEEREKKNDVEQGEIWISAEAITPLTYYSTDRSQLTSILIIS